MRQLSESLLDDLLGKDHFPDEVLQVMVEIFSNEHLQNINGADHFLTNSSLFFDRMSEIRKEALLQALRQNFFLLVNQQTIWVFCDFISRKYNPCTALEALKLMIENSSKEGLSGVSLGLDILLNSEISDSDFMSEVTRAIDSV